MIFGKSINKYYFRFAHLFIFGLISLVIVDYVQLEIPILTGELIDGLDLGTMDRSGILDLVKLIGIYVAIIIVGRFLWRMFIFGASRRVDYGLRNEMYRHCENLSNNFYSENKVGGLMAHFTNDVESVRRAIGPGMIMFVDAMFLGGLAFYHMFNLDPFMALFAGIPLVIIAILGAYMGRKMRIKFKEAQKAFEDLSDFTNENLSGIDVVKAFVKEDTEIDEFLKINLRAKRKNVSYVKSQTILQMSIRAITGIIYVIILGYGGYLVSKTAGSSNEFTIGNLSTFILLFGSLLWPMRALGMIINVRSRGKGSLQRIEKILNEKVDVFDSKDVIKVDKIDGTIEFKDLSFSYPDGFDNALTNISFKVNVGETVGILGRTGSGKTSLVDLLLRIYNVNENQLFIDGIDIMKLPIKKVRESIGYVPQDGFLFSDSISNNISLGLEKRQDYFNDIQEAAKLSDVHDNIVEFSEEYETIIGERGVTLSGGQRQRLSIARALIKDPSILILDDSVSAVDTKTEETILENLSRVRKGKTTLIIAHRISTIKDADKIIIVDDGKVIDVGTHDELLTRCSFYLDMVERQKLEDEVEVA
jgi:ATP-binding cassette subfamily B protein